MVNVILYIRSLFSLNLAYHISAYRPRSLCDPGVPSRILESLEPEMEANSFRPECEEGQYLDGYTCRPCEEGTFMTKRMADEKTHRRCVQCYEPAMYEIVTEPCSTTRDATVMCEDQFYRVEDSGNPCRSRCERCDECGVGRNMFRNFPRRECGGHNNTICCARPDTVAVDGVCIRTSTASTTTSTTKATDPTDNVVLDEWVEEDLIVGAFTNGSNVLGINCLVIPSLLLTVSIVYGVNLYLNVT